MKTFTKTYCSEEARARFDEFWSLDRLGKALWIQKHGYCGFITETITIQENFLGICVTTCTISKGIHGFFPKRTTQWLFKYDLVRKKGQCVSDRFSIKSILIKYPEWEFLNSLKDTRCLSMAVVRDILLGKLTSVDMVVRTYFKSLGIKGYSGKELLRLTDFGGCLTEVLTVFDIKTLIPTLRDREQRAILMRQRDIIDQAYLLGVKLNPRWSEKRFYEEHQKLTYILMQSELERKNCLPVWDLPKDFSGYPGIGEDVKFLNDERAIFEEGTFMHHCLYTNYWRKIRNKEYIAFNVKLPSGDKATLGIRRNSYEGIWQFDQCYKKYDAPVEGLDFVYVSNLARSICKLFPRISK